MQLIELGDAVTILAAFLGQVPVHMEMIAIPTAAVHVSYRGFLEVCGVCQVVVSGFAKLQLVADDHEKCYAALWQVVLWRLCERIFATSGYANQKLNGTPDNVEP